ncbi:MAG: RnfABCDGE type electron transport complex subunit D [Clostridiales bacterium]|nr:RnfABCDGE type electron transport complex subunit D [Clostridiales bacterium]
MKKNKFLYSLRSQTQTLRGYMVDMLVMLIVPSILAFYYYGLRAVMLEFFSVATAVVCEFVACKIMGRKSTVGNLSAIFTGAVIALLLPASAPFWLPMVGSAFAIIVAKVPFGTAEKAPFVPAAAGIAFLTICWPDIIFTYPQYLTKAVVWDSPDFIMGESLTSMLSLGKSITPNWFTIIDVIVGKISGPMGATCMIVTFFMAIYLLIRRPKSFVISLSFMFAVAIIAILFPRVHTGRKISLLMEISSGMTVFAALLFMTDPATAPKRLLSRIFYGFVGGVITMLLRYFGPYQEGVCFAVMLVNSFWLLVDGYINSLGDLISEKIKSRKGGKVSER